MSAHTVEIGVCAKPRLVPRGHLAHNYPKIDICIQYIFTIAISN